MDVMQKEKRPPYQTILFPQISSTVIWMNAYQRNSLVMFEIMFY